ncbi:MAG: hypothetical protein IIY62_00435 [Kiritimatiellae bacterium]|nr:hypothetical protein [Kiritimatiellia bacterium]
MANENERHADIIAEMRNEGHTGPADALEWVREKMTYYAARLEAAHKREVQDALDTGGYVEASRRAKQSGNAAKLREAVGYILKYADSAACRDHDEHTRHYIDQIRKWAQSALAEPPRQCNIGTAAEQTKRFKDFCERQGECMGEDCTCPIVFTPGICELVWAQLPYEEGGAK